LHCNIGSLQPSVIVVFGRLCALKARLPHLNREQLLRHDKAYPPALGGVGADGGPKCIGNYMLQRAAQLEDGLTRLRRISANEGELKVLNPQGRASVVRLNHRDVLHERLLDSLEQRLKRVLRFGRAEVSLSSSSFCGR